MKHKLLATVKILFRCAGNGVLGPKTKASNALDSSDPGKKSTLQT